MIYEPREDSFLLKKSVLKYSKNKSVLDIGTGSGIQSFAAKEAGAKSILSTDVNQEAVAHVKSLGFNTIKSNIFSKVKGKFDLIICNPPYLPKDDREDPVSALITSGGKRGDELTCKFLEQADKHLNKNGIILLLLSSLTPKEKILKILEKNKMSFSVISEEKMDFEVLQVWEIS